MEFEEQVPKVRGRIVTTLQKAKEVRPLVEKCITIARKSIEPANRAKQLEPSAAKGTDAWKTWRNGKGWQDWAVARAPAIAARRRALQLLGNKAAVHVLFEEIAPRMLNRPGGYTRILRLATPRLGDAGTRAILEFVGMNDRSTKVKTVRRAVIVEDDEIPPAPVASDADSETS
jgi:large subunit ribosomal protein L17